MADGHPVPRPDSDRLRHVLANEVLFNLTNPKIQQASLKHSGPLFAWKDQERLVIIPHARGPAVRIDIHDSIRDRDFKPYALDTQADASGPNPHPLHVGQTVVVPIHAERSQTEIVVDPIEKSSVPVLAPLLKLFFRFKTICLPFAARCEGIPLNNSARLEHFYAEGLMSRYAVNVIYLDQLTNTDERVPHTDSAFGDVFFYSTQINSESTKHTDARVPVEVQLALKFAKLSQTESDKKHALDILHEAARSAYFSALRQQDPRRAKVVPQLFGLVYDPTVPQIGFAVQRLKPSNSWRSFVASLPACPSHTTLVRARLAFRLLESCIFMHDRHIFHNDLHGDNVLIDEFHRPFIIDFGMIDIPGGTSSTTSGTNPELDDVQSLRDLLVNMCGENPSEEWPLCLRRIIKRLCRVFPNSRYKGSTIQPDSKGLLKQGLSFLTRLYEHCGSKCILHSPKAKIAEMYFHFANGHHWPLPGEHELAAKWACSTCQSSLSSLPAAAINSGSDGTPILDSKGQPMSDATYLARCKDRPWN